MYRDLASYNASKHGVIGYTRSFQLMPHICNVRVNALCPFWVGKTHFYAVQNTCHVLIYHNHVETDLLPSFKSTEKDQEDPYLNVIRHSPRTSIKTVVDGFLTLVLDPARNSEYTDDCSRYIALFVNLVLQM